MLYFVATPIGNLKDITFRAIEVLKNCDYILCEDTRTSSVLLKHYDINKPLYSYHKFNEQQQKNKVVSDLKDNKNICVISDAGMPCISDPGFVLLQEVIKEKLEYTVIPGASAGLMAFVLSGFNVPFTFIGFLPNKKQETMNLLKEVKDYKSTLIFYVSPHNIEENFKVMFEVLGNRKVAVTRELTKAFEEVNFTTLKDGYSGVVKGEFVLVVEGNNGTNEFENLTIVEHIQHYINLGFSKNDAIKIVAKERNIKKSEVYKEATQLSK